MTNFDGKTIEIVEYVECPECGKKYGPDELGKNERITEVFNPKTTCPDCLITVIPHYKKVKIDRSGNIEE